MSAVFFTDRDLGNTFPEILAAAGLSVERHRDHFAPDCADEAWLRGVGQNGWVALTRDARIRYKPNELAAVVSHRVTLLVVTGQAPHRELARTIVATAGRVANFLNKHSPPLIGKIHRPSPAELARNPDTPGTVSLWYPKSR